MTPPAIAIAGAGIAGLTAALALAARGYRVELLEQAERLDAIGAGLQLSPNASRVLIALGLGDALAPRATLLDGIRIHSARSERVLTTIPLGEAASQRAGAPYWAMHRADLQDVLLQAARAHPAITLRLGARCDDMMLHEDGIALRVGGEQLAAAALIGADGVRSAARRHVCDVAPEFSGLVAWRGMIDVQSFAGARPEKFVTLWMGGDAHLVTYPIAGGTRINVVAILRGDADAPANPASVADALAKAGWPAAPRALIAACETLTRYPLFTMSALSRWTAGPVALIGDAAHAMLPFAAQGAGMAIEDAAVLAACIGEARAISPTEIAAALARYDGLRRDRVTRVAGAARQSGRIYHLRGASAAARDLTIRALGGDRLLARQDWIYGWTPP